MRRDCLSRPLTADPMGRSVPYRYRHAGGRGNTALPLSHTATAVTRPRKRDLERFSRWILNDRIPARSDLRMPHSWYMSWLIPPRADSRLRGTALHSVCRRCFSDCCCCCPCCYGLYTVHKLSATSTGGTVAFSLVHLPCSGCDKGTVGH